MYGIDSAIRHATGDGSGGLTKEDVKRIISNSVLQTTSDAMNGRKVTSKSLNDRLRKNALTAINARRPGTRQRKTIPVKLLRGLRGGVEAELALKRQTFAIPHRLKKSRAFGTGLGGGKKRGSKARRAKAARRKRKVKRSKRKTGGKRRKGGVRAMKVAAAKKRYMATRDVFDLV